MKQVITLTLLSALATISFGQQTVQKPVLTKVDYMQKSKSQKKIATILLLSGAGLMATSFIIPRGDLVYDGICVGYYCDDEYENDGIKTAFFLVGAASAVTSIPFFIASKKNRRKANASVFINMEKAAVPQQSAIRNQSFPAIALKIGL